MSDQQGGESLPPEWAEVRVNKLFSVEPPKEKGKTEHAYSVLHRAFARYIAEHEEAPVDPLDAEVAALLVTSSFFGGQELRALLAEALRRGMELARQPQSPESTS